MASSLYSNLDASNKEIRLVTIQPDKDHLGCVECSLSIASLEEQVLFDALSYCWGSPANPETISIDGQQVSVTKNLGQALRHFQKTKDGSEIPIWIDAICINQKDIPERSAQVTMMGDIYRKASTVHIWLGGPEVVSKAGMHALRELCQFDSKHARGAAAAWPKIADPLRNDKLADMESIARNEYWRRTWILQEISFTTNVIVHGSHDRVELHFRDGDSKSKRLPFVDMYNRLQTGQESLEQVRKIAEIFEPMNMAAWSDGARYAVAAGDPAFLRVPQVLFTRFRYSLATDPRDKVYGMLSLLPDVFQDVRPDYSKTMAEVYQDATVELMRKAKDIEVLTQACSQSSELPSWIPDFRVPSRMPKYLTDYWTTCRSGVLAEMNIEATQSGTLHTKALYVDRIAYIERGGDFEPERGFFEIRQPILRWFALFYQHSASLPTTDGIDRDFVFWRAVCGGGADGEAFEIEHKIACQQLMGYAGVEAPEIEIEDFYDRDFVGYLSRLVQENDFYITANGLAGLIPGNSGDVGDEIYILAGSPVPFCMRKLQERAADVYTLRAPCFVENHVASPLSWENQSQKMLRGIMDGGIVLQKAQCQRDDHVAIDSVFKRISIA